MRAAARVFIGGLLAVLLQAASGAAAASALQLVRSEAAVSGDRVTVVLIVSDAAALGVAQVEALELSVVYDEAALEFTAARAGSYFNGGASVLPNASEPGMLRVALASSIVPGAVTDGSSLLVLDFRVTPAAPVVGDPSVQGMAVQINESAAPVDVAGPGSTDGDGDGLNDVWEVLNGLNPTDGTDPALDPDLDGFSSRDEALAGSDPRDVVSVPDAPYLPHDVTGTWDVYTFSDDAAQANAPWAEECEVTLGVDGVSTGVGCTDLDGVNELVTPGDLSLSVDETGAVTLGGAFIDETTVTDAHMDIGRTAIARMEGVVSGGVPGEQVLNLIIERGAAYRQQELAGRWHVFQFGDRAVPGVDGSFWVRAELEFDELGVLTAGAQYQHDAPETAVTLTGSATLAADGEVSLDGELSESATVLWQRLDAGRTVVAGVAREAFDGGAEVEDSLRVWVKQGGVYAQADAAGVWHTYLLSDTSGVQAPLVEKITLRVEPDGTAAADGFSSAGDVFTAEGVMTVGTDGVLTLGDGLGFFDHQHLRMDAGKTVLAGVVTEDDAGMERPGLLFGVRSVASRPRVVFPAPGNVLGDTVATFAWTGNGTPATNWRLEIGTTTGARDLFDSGVLSSETRRVTVGGLPNDGRTLHARLGYRVGGVWQSADFDYQAANIVGAQPPSFAHPVVGSELPGSSATFFWQTNGTPVTRWQLLLGSSPGGSDLFSSPLLDAGTLSLAVSALPTDGRTIHARLRYDAGGFKDVDAQFLAADIGLPALTAPAPGGTLSGSAVTFEWSLYVQPMEDFQLWVGSVPGRNDLGDSGSLGALATSFEMDGLPVDGRAVYVRLRYRLLGQWAWADYGFTAADLPLPALTSPAEVLLAGSDVLFEWSSNGHAVTDWQFLAGSRLGRSDLGKSAVLGAGTSGYLIEGLPADGRPVYVRLRARIARKWVNADYTFSAAELALPELTSPAPGAVLTSTSALFEWTFNGQPVQDSELWVGTSFGKSQVLRARRLGAETIELPVENLPADGGALYVRLRYKLLGKWLWADYQLRASGPAQPALTSPAVNSTLPGSSATFEWSMNGLAVTDIQLRAGSKPGATNYGTSGSLGAGATSFTFDALPADGSVVYVRLMYRVGRAWRTVDYGFTAADLPLPALTSPVGVLLAGSDVLFAWSANGHAVTDWQFLAGSRLGRSDLGKSAVLGAGESGYLIEGLPADGRTVYVRLRARIARKWVNADYSFSAAELALPELTSPAPGAVLTSTSALFEWTFNGQPVQDSELWVGTTFGKSQVLRARRLGAETRELLVENLPADGGALYVRLRYKLLGKWQWADYQLRASGPVQPALTSPAVNSTLPGSAVTFEWSMNGLAVTDIQLRAGSKPGATNYGTSGSLGAGATSFTFDALPADGSAVYVRLMYRVGRAWRTADYGFTASDLPLPALTSPAEVLLAGSDVLFEWSSNGHAVTNWQFLAGSRLGRSDLGKSAVLGAGTSGYLIEGLPADGRPVYVRLRARIARKWVNADYTFSAAELALPELTSPAPGAVLTSTSALFEWTFNGQPVQDSELWVGTSFGKSQVLRARRLGAETRERLVENLPGNVRTIFVRLRYKLLGKWQFADSLISMDVD